MNHDLVESLEDRFYRLAKQWEEDPGVRVASSITLISQHPAYQEIIAMGWDAVPLILGELSIEPGHWFVALYEITGEDPVPEDCHGNMRKMTEYWLAWGKEHEINLPERRLLIMADHAEDRPGENTEEIRKTKYQIVHDWFMDLGLTEEARKLLTVEEALALLSAEALALLSPNPESDPPQLSDDEKYPDCGDIDDT
ncbi:MAG: hypothetical protein V1807_02765 [Patescibacteria group bacterium]